MRVRFSVLVGLLAIAAGVFWMLELAIDIDVPWQWLPPIALVLFGLLLILSRTGRGDSRVERDDTPHVP